MCGRYALSLRPSQIRRMLEEDDMPVADSPEDEGPGAPRQSYNFAPGYHGIVYRADTPDRGAGSSRQHGEAADEGPRDSAGPGSGLASGKETLPACKLQSMRWGLIPFWTKRNPDYASMMKTINCRDDSLAASGGMWASIKGRKRCVVVAQGFFEWLKVAGGRDKVPHFVKRSDGHLMCFAGLWDCVQYQDSEEKIYTYTIITTDSNPQLKFLHDRMPVILNPGSDELRTWLDPRRHEWSSELQSLLRPFDGRLDVYPVTKDVGKVGNNSPSFIIPVDSKENKANIANFFANAGVGNKKKASAATTTTTTTTSSSASVRASDSNSRIKKEEAKDGVGDMKAVKKEEEQDAGVEIKEVKKEMEPEVKKEAKKEEEEEDKEWPPQMFEGATAAPHDLQALRSGDLKRKASRSFDDEDYKQGGRSPPPPAKAAATELATGRGSPEKHKTRSATKNEKRTPSKAKNDAAGSRKITSFFTANSA